MVSQLQAVAHGTNHPKVAEAVARAQQAKQLLAEAVAAAQQAAQAAHDYMAVLG
jgi:4-aminobutyrate aminotransferase-like enzyme